MAATGRLLYETHTHTPLCRHAVGEPEEYAQVAWQRGLRGMAVTCHNPMPDGFSPGVRMRGDQLAQYVELVQRARDAWEGRVDIRLGLECDFFPGQERWLGRQLAAADFDCVLGSVHPQTAEYRERFFGPDPAEFHRTYFRHLADAAATGLFDCLAHPDFVKNETPEAWSPAAIMGDVRRALDRIAAAGVALEINTSGANKAIAEMSPFPAMLAEMRARSIPVVIGSDAHEPDRVGDRFREAVDLLMACGYERLSYFLHRRRHDVPLPQARESLVDHTQGHAEHER